MKLLMLIFFSLIASQAYSCKEWFQTLKIQDHKNCETICKTSLTDMSSFMCTDKCNSLCKSLNSSDKNQNFYGLTDDEIKFCKENKVDCLKAYQQSWDAEKICLSIYPVSDVNDESHACRHYVWSILLSKTIGDKNAETVLNAHENNTKEANQDRAMDLANNRLGLLNFQKIGKNLTSKEEILKSFRQQLKENKFIILKPNYKNS